MPTRRLPAQPDLAHLKHQADDLLRQHAAGEAQALHRLREFDPRFRSASDESIAAADLEHSDALLAIAREYGFPSWPKLKAFVDGAEYNVLDLPAHERITDQVFRRAVDLLDAGDADRLRAHLKAHPDLVRSRVELLGGNYFQHPTLLEFIAENPARRRTLPKNAAELATIILDAGATADRESMDSALGLVASSSVARESGVQRNVIRVLCERGADVNAGVLPALLYGEFEAVEELFRCGARMSVLAAAAFGKNDDLKRGISGAPDEERRLALALAAQHGRFEAVRMLLDAGTDPNGFIPVEGHSHSTPLHQAALAGHDSIANLLIERGAKRDVRDILYNSTPAEWAAHAGHARLARALE